ncbi:malto-oligosyltrehalose synthase [Sagittula salina]|uniref:Malto-oligosyltrehalose synthase n=1 Tax=Sagittula salina TaxID=2820268 RepID=A0A940MMQ7_9RHOB|nr:malto-oligosyltrehalose synthase [Sagittula salina]MBP0482169.1 malto-oligosyltrehalose synthase [Sagittula salina]
MSHPVATYRLQLRQGVDFARAIDLLPHISQLGVSHLYLSPLFTAAEGSTHGYDVANPAEIDPTLGGEDGFARLAKAARGHGLQIILDLVPNHTVLSVENPWLLDALTHGADSAYAPFFDVDWGRGLILPILPKPLEEMLEEGAFRLEGERIVWEGGWLPLAPGTTSGPVADVLERQHWHLRFWQTERRRLTHRRFFNITQLIGMRVEDRAVFDAMHALPLRLLREGLAQGLRIDHVDGLADPAEYLRWLRAEASPDTPIWVEKILTGDEPLPDWPIEGTTGYEANDRITRLLLDGGGLDRLDTIWRGATGARGGYEDACRQARREILAGDLGAELNELVTRAGAALTEIGQESPADLRDTLRAMLTVFPQYRSYIDVDGPRPEDSALIRHMREEAATLLRDRATLDALCTLMVQANGPAVQGFTRRYQQVTGAVVAKAQEDTAFYRHTRCLAEAEVGSEPDAESLTPAAFAEWCRDRLAQWPEAMTLGSSHDTKRAEDARARLVALTHRPEAARALWSRAQSIEAGETVDDSIRWYALQSALAIWEEGRTDLEDRLAAHMEKALREAKEVTSWHDPDARAEGEAQTFARALLAAWRKAPDPALTELVTLGEALSLDQLALRCLIPGVPDIYQGTEAGSFALTDPDNRAPLDPSQSLTDFGERKTALLRELLRLRRRWPEVFGQGTVTVEETPYGLALTRSHGARSVTLTLTPEGPRLDTREAALDPTG